jgi:hypothetical protein
MRAYIVCQKCNRIHGCVYIDKGKQSIEICFNCRYKPERPCEDTEIKYEVHQLCFNCLIDLAFNLKN